jgi:hypothetical protein
MAQGSGGGARDYPAPPHLIAGNARALSRRAPDAGKMSSGPSRADLPTLTLLVLQDADCIMVAEFLIQNLMIVHCDLSRNVRPPTLL